MNRIDLDHNATTPLDPAVAETMIAVMREIPGNPSTRHTAGRRARETVEEARASVARLIDARPEEIIFTSGGTEANNLALAGTLLGRGERLVISAIEHPSVLECAAHLESRGFEVKRVEPGASGTVDADEFVDACEPGTSLASLMLANNETGCLQPVAVVARRARSRGIRVHTDAVQAIGKLPVSVEALGVDLLTLSGHKIGGPQGSGALWARTGCTPRAILHGGDQEHGVRAGTENVVAIAGLGKAAELAASRAGGDAETVSRRRDLFERLLLEKLPVAVPLGRSTERLGNTSYVAFPGLEAKTLVQLLDLKGVAASTGAACKAGSDEHSHVLKAMRIPIELARGAVRFSLGRDTTETEVSEAARRVRVAVAEIVGEVVDRQRPRV